MALQPLIDAVAVEHVQAQRQPLRRLLLVHVGQADGAVLGRPAVARRPRDVVGTRFARWLPVKRGHETTATGTVSLPLRQRHTLVLVRVRRRRRRQRQRQEDAIIGADTARGRCLSLCCLTWKRAAASTVSVDLRRRRPLRKAQEARPGDEVGADARVVGGADGDPEDEDDGHGEDGAVAPRRGDPDDGVDERAREADAGRGGDGQRPHAGHAVRHGTPGRRPDS